ncbi:recombination directionality factor [Ramlibacter albus]|uniref:Uncharacterized protein n=1 Tax=Ramlibacter albus TaxID=2079448 RepID=A0A923S4K0_9BURK|nr:hypothetical protein [Ramlibacter albus]MBC5767585.1 hypothetical protein [Ramlibacter albus]
MNLNHIACHPHAVGFIKVACEEVSHDGAIRTTNAFLVTSREHESVHEGTTVPKLAKHPVSARLEEGEGEERAVREIPIRMFFNSTDKALSIRYQAYSQASRMPACSGDGKNARRLTRAADLTPTFQDRACPGPELCDLVASGEVTCSRQVRMPVQIVGEGDGTTVFEVRTGSLNTFRALKAQLKLIEGRFVGLRHVPLKLTLWRASNEASGYQPFSLMQLQIAAASDIEAMAQAKTARQELADAGINDDVDRFMTIEDSEVETFTRAAVDFPAVSEFYATADSGRRAGAEPVTHTALSNRGSAVAATQGANAAIANLVSQAQLPEPQMEDIPL